MEKIYSLAKYTRIKSLEDLVVKIGYDPTNVEAVEEILKKKNANIAALRKQLKMSTTEDSLTKDIEENEAQKAKMMKLIMEQSAQLKKMETKMEKLVKEKEKATELSTIPLDVVPIVVIPTATPTTIGT